ncbi:MAG: serine--tRNA ligase [Nitrospirae bacterium]|nr:serine--tRNA ligase [Nitrospirota bacterium]
MLDLKHVYEHLDEVRERLGRRGNLGGLEALLPLYEQRRTLIPKLEGLRSRRKVQSEAIGKVQKAGGDVEAEKAKVRELAGEIARLESELQDVEARLHAAALLVPNLPHESVPKGMGPEDNPVVRVWGEKPTCNFEPRDHSDLGETLGILDPKAGAKLAGARFVVSRGLGARLERALINFMLDLQTREHGYLEILPPFMVKRDSMIGTGQLPKFEEDMFKVEGWDHFLVPTAEVPLTNLLREELLSEEDLPIKYTAYTPCFRKEAGSYGKDVKGIIRQHQFNKVEIVRFCTPETSYVHLEELLGNAEEVLRRLGLHYRVVALCTGDLGFSSAKTYDLEVWLPGQNEYKEISSCSNFEAFQARRANIRYRRKADRKTDFVHTLNGSALAVGRTVVAILEQYQQADGSVRVPEALRPYLDGLDRITRC